MAPPALHRKSHAQQGHPSNSKSLRPASSPFGHLNSAFLVLGFTLILSFFILRQLDILSSGEWPESKHITYLLSDHDREHLQAALNTQPNNPVILAFYSETCLACRRMKSHFLRCAEQVEGVPFYAAHVADEKNFQLAKTFNIETIPAILLLNANRPKSSPKLYKGRPNTRQLVDFVNTATDSEESPR